MRYNMLLFLLALTVIAKYPPKKQVYHLCIDNNLDHNLLEICLFAHPGNKRASHIVYMQPHSKTSIDLPFACAELTAHAWLGTKKASKVLEVLDNISVHINENNDGSFVVTQIPNAI